ncbi:MAG: hypothetical protein A2711_03695 [Burkholderiales bacterium RIFCSPHIGHO2_01_FULL_63_240]|jgi:hypothetical protein|nr:MAG: hypothetical protein A2711_03695 [Burkholderiales bacterium RIFCSPHIGHO2_01_FULL_63_240]
MNGLHKFLGGVVASTVLAASAFAQVTTTTNLGELSATPTNFGNTFNQSVNFSDIYTFSIAGNGSVSGYTNDSNTFRAFIDFRDVDITSLILYKGTTVNPSTVMDYDLYVPAANTFTFSGLTAGTYSLAVNGNVSLGAGSGDLAKYSGQISTTAVASPAPEASDVAMTLMGLAGVGFMLRRRKQQA